MVNRARHLDLGAAVHEEQVLELEPVHALGGRLEHPLGGPLLALEIAQHVRAAQL